VDANADGVGAHIAFPDHEQRVDFHLFSAFDVALDLIAVFRAELRPYDS